MLSFNKIFLNIDYKVYMTLNSIKFLLKLKNSALKQKISCVCLVSFQKIQLCKILYKKGLIQSFFIKEKYIFVQHRFLNSFSPLRTLKLISRPSRIIILSNKIIHRLKVSSSVFFFNLKRTLYFKRM